MNLQQLLTELETEYTDALTASAVPDRLCTLLRAIERVRAELGISVDGAHTTFIPLELQRDPAIQALRFKRSAANSTKPKANR